MCWRVSWGHGDRQLDAEVASLSHDNSAKVLSMFYTRLSEIRDFFRKNPSSSLTDVNLDIRHLMNEGMSFFAGLAGMVLFAYCSEWIEDVSLAFVLAGGLFAPGGIFVRL